MIESKTKSIDGFSYTVTPLPAMSQMKLLTRLLKSAGPSIGQLGAALKGIGSAADLKKLDVERLVPAIGALFSALEDAEVEHLTRALLESALVDNKGLWPLFNNHFQGKMLSLFKLIGFALEVNYGDFSGGLVARALQLAKGSLSDPSSTSSGPVSG